MAKLSAAKASTPHMPLHKYISACTSSRTGRTTYAWLVAMAADLSQKIGPTSVKNLVMAPLALLVRKSGLVLSHGCRVVPKWVPRGCTEVSSNRNSASCRSKKVVWTTSFSLRHLHNSLSPLGTCNCLVHKILSRLFSRSNILYTKAFQWDGIQLAFVVFLSIFPYSFGLLFPTLIL